MLNANLRASHSASFCAIGASAGGVTAIRRLLQSIDSRNDLPIGIVQHMPSNSRIDVSLIYGGAPNRRVIEVEDKMKIESSYTYMSAPGYHLLIEKDRSFGLTQDDLENYSRPSIDVFFKTVATVFGASAIGILLTGANSDGAAGLKAISDRGGLTIVQEPGEAECDTMPRSALDLFRPTHVLPLNEIAAFLNLVSFSSEELRI